MGQDNIHTPIPIHTIVIFPRIQIDTSVAIFLLKKFGETYFSGIEQAAIEFWTLPKEGKNGEELEKEGYLLIDMGNGRFDHHPDGQENKTECASSLVAAYLRVDTDAALAMLLEFARRADLTGKGVVSADSLDRAFGLPGLLMNMNRVYHGQPEKILHFMLELISVHYEEQYQRKHQLVQEWKDIQKSPGFKKLEVSQLGKKLQVIVLPSDNVFMPGFVRAYARVDVVLQVFSSGHVNIITRQERGVNLDEVARYIRLHEAKKKGVTLQSHGVRDLYAPGRVAGIEEWYYDTAGNSLQNGGVLPKEIPPTKLPIDEVQQILIAGLEDAKEIKNTSRGPRV